MEDKIKYQDWPEMVKMATALSSKNFVIKNPKIPRTLGYIVLTMGLLDLIFIVFQDGISDFTNLLHPLAVMIIGVLNLGSSRMLKWIAEHSSWEERFANTSSTAHKFINVLSIAILFLCVYVIIVYR